MLLLVKSCSLAYAHPSPGGTLHQMLVAAQEEAQAHPLQHSSYIRQAGKL